MNRYKTITRPTTTTTHTLTLGQGTTLDDLRRFVEATAHLGAGTPVQSAVFGNSIDVHEVRVNNEEKSE